MIDPAPILALLDSMEGQLEDFRVYNRTNPGHASMHTLGRMAQLDDDIRALRATLPAEVPGKKETHGA